MDVEKYLYSLITTAADYFRGNFGIDFFVQEWIVVDMPESTNITPVLAEFREWDYSTVLLAIIDGQGNRMKTPIP